MHAKGFYLHKVTNQLNLKGYVNIRNNTGVINRPKAFIESLKIALNKTKQKHLDFDVQKLFFQT